ILDGPGFTGPDGKSIMPSYADSLSVAQLVDLVAFLRGLTGGGHMHAMAPAEKTTDVYTVRLDYRGGVEHAAHEAHAGHAAAASPSPRRSCSIGGRESPRRRASPRSAGGRLRRGQRRVVVRLGSDLLHVLDVLHLAVLADHEDRARGEPGDRTVLDLDPVSGPEGALAEVGERLDGGDPGRAAPALLRERQVAADRPDLDVAAA